MSIKEMKAVIKEAGLSFADCAEKSDLRQRTGEALARLAQAKSATPSPSANTASSSASSTVGGWKTRFEYRNGAAEGDAELAVILLHGYGAGADDLVPLADALSAQLLGTKCLFAFPAATGMPAAWWPLDPMMWMSAASGGAAALGKLIRTEFPGLVACRAKGAALIADVASKTGGAAPLVVGGFSQGAMTSMDFALACEATEKIAGVLHISGAPIVVEQWAKSVKTRPGLPVYVSHGRSDPILPFAVSGWTKELLEKGGAVVTYAPHSGSHGVGPLEPIAAFLKARLD